MIKVRFNLGRGNNYKKWKITYADGTHEIVDPDEYQLILTNCQLKNNKTTANKIFNGKHKLVCAWVLCESIKIESDYRYQAGYGIQIEYNPKKHPFWSLDGIDIDESNFKTLYTVNNKLFIF